ncbi:hypothetical protein NDU88_003003 [Pleurodeles waltl]|uniref:Uncharacterized protein n=1 Tax=Pleurodeles waltl TaxID=8319 RepID=A0AAV7SEZ2_PLEWA|nr:hypothetical protein NDU88_003003 [Pleurodeles waltl]
MCAGSRVSARDNIGGAASWARAALELHRSHREVSHVPLSGSVGRVSTGCAAAPTTTFCSALDSGKTAGGVRKPVVAVEPSDQRWSNPPSCVRGQLVLARQALASGRCGCILQEAEGHDSRQTAFLSTTDMWTSFSSLAPLGCRDNCSLLLLLFRCFKLLLSRLGLEYTAGFDSVNLGSQTWGLRLVLVCCGVGAQPRVLQATPSAMIQLQNHAGLYTLREDACYFRCGGWAWCQRFLQEEGNGAGQPGEASAQEVERGPGRLRRAIHKAHAAKDTRSGHPLRGRPLPAAYPQSDLSIDSTLV